LQWLLEYVFWEINFRDLSPLLYGDTPAESMPVVLKEAEKPITLVKVPHHSSKGSLLSGFEPGLCGDFGG
jgi:Predicted hydrolase (metallo-beta-lactamase superfamily)